MKVNFTLIVPFALILSSSAMSQPFSAWKGEDVYEYREFRENVDPRIHLSCEIEKGEAYTGKHVSWRVINLTSDPVNVDITIQYIRTCGKSPHEPHLRNKKPIASGSENALADDMDGTDPKTLGFNFRGVLKECGDNIELRDIKILKCQVFPVVSATASAAKPKDDAAVASAEPVATKEAKQSESQRKAEEKALEKARQEEQKKLDEKAKQEIKAEAEQAAKDKKASEEKAKQSKKSMAENEKQAKKEQEAKAKQEKKDQQARAKQQKKEQEEQAKRDKQAKKEEEKAKKDLQAQQKKAKSSEQKGNTASQQSKETKTNATSSQEQAKSGSQSTAGTTGSPQPAAQNATAPDVKPAQETAAATPVSSETVPTGGAEEAAEKQPENKLMYSDDILKVYENDFQSKAFVKIKDLNLKIKKLSEVGTGEAQANRVINESVALFLDEERVVEVSNVITNDKKTWKIRPYLERIKMLPYSRVNVQWSKIALVTNFEKQPNGEYTATAQFEQTFEGLRDEQVIYRDTTEKKITIHVRLRTKVSEGQQETVWDVFLGDIGVVQTKS